ncbi:serine/threonine protein kinase [Nocardiopsis sp. TSRI0078]|uniref:ATP-binding protein n=1 Tax=unclassified Nocardiopsis TaxID=2649073 RepID=UPI00093EA1A5|nr:ATP-binding protein [Nocardiopsis sp. TSRI0078]OKI20756.1 serine/threonine protein kinase [Nocardiopsis sp. TSRI0078]
MSGDHTPLDAGDRPHQVERSVTLPYTPASVTDARQRLCRDLRAMKVDEERVDDAALVLSELVSNALRHARPLPTPGNPENSVGVSWRAEADRGSQSGGWVEIAVRDGGSCTMPRVAPPSVSGLGGRGLSIVQTLSGRWGTEMDATTTTVWAVLEIPADGAADEEEGTAEGLPESLGKISCPDAADVVELRLDDREDERARSALI